MEERILGKTGLSVGVLSFGGIVIRDTLQREAAWIVSNAIERGINYFDVAPSYGNAQQVLGSVIKTKRDKMFLASKTNKRTKDGALKDLYDSLKSLHTDYIDVYQLHAMTEDEVQKVFGPNGAMDALEMARTKGLIRYIGFSSHYDDAAIKLMQEYDFDTMLFPVNWVSRLKNGVGKAALEEAAKRNMGCIAVKSLAESAKENEFDGYPRCWYKPISNDMELANLALRFTLSQAVHTSLSPSDVRLLELSLSILEKYDGVPTPLSDMEFAFLKKRAQEVILAVF
ncbi:MAG: aldo/keto reductase [Treponema sp.]|jgi:aryl-alcohol dehydrogenase-like predicted oxidoreductase|nr:aldo/keto reductase [Treponema sp.]